MHTRHDVRCGIRREIELGQRGVAGEDRSCEQHVARRVVQSAQIDYARASHRSEVQQMVDNERVELRKARRRQHARQPSQRCALIVSSTTLHTPVRVPYIPEVSFAFLVQRWRCKVADVELLERCDGPRRQRVSDERALDSIESDASHLQRFQPPGTTFSQQLSDELRDQPSPNNDLGRRFCRSPASPRRHARTQQRVPAHIQPRKLAQFRGSLRHDPESVGRHCDAAKCELSELGMGGSERVTHKRHAVVSQLARLHCELHQTGT
eukprot:3932840-Rhodomonas_salina.3